jgi:hypothetical protein
MKVIPRYLSAVITVVSVVVVTVAGVTNAAGSGMRVAPVRSDLTMKPGTSRIVTIQVSNVTGATEVLKVVTNDFVARSDESGAPALLLNGQTNDQHGLKRYIITQNTVTIGAGQRKDVKVEVNLPKTLPGGGYYGAVRFVPTGSSINSNVSLSGSVGSLILVKVPGDVTEKMTIAGFFTNTKGVQQSRTLFTTGKNIQVTARFQNEGDVQEEPFGKVILKKGSKEIKTFDFNGGNLPSNVLPDSIRRFTVDLSGVGSFGKYTVYGNFGYGSTGQLLSGSTTFYVIPVWVISAVVILILLLLFFIFVLPKMVKNYNRNVVRKASRRR